MRPSKRLRNPKRLDLRAGNRRPRRLNGLPPMKPAKPKAARIRLK